jgi:hypothetical protein
MLSDLLANMQPEIISRSGLADITYHTGPEFLVQEEEPPRIIWIPLSDEFSPAQGIGGNPRQVMIRRAGCEVHVWGTDYAQTEKLIHSTVMALHRYGVGARTVEGGDWNNGTLDVKFGREYVFTFHMFVPVVDIIFPTAPSEIQTHATSRILFPDETEFTACEQIPTP